MLCVDRSKNFEKSGEYATAWKKNEDGKMEVDGPRVQVVGGQSQVPQAGYITRCADTYLTFILTFVYAVCLLFVWSCRVWTVKQFEGRRDNRLAENIVPLAKTYRWLIGR